MKGVRRSSREKSRRPNSSRVLSSQFFIGCEFPKYVGRIECLLGNEEAAIKVTADNFTGALKE